MAAERVRPLAEVGDDAAPYFSMVLAHRRGQAWR
jgi:precorrin-2/cobalt-factor-2 C20-methyltransferase